MKKQSMTLNKLQPGDQVAVLSPSAGLPGLFPWVHELGLERLSKNFELVPKEYPTTRQMGSSLHDRARDLMAAFEDENNKAVIAAIGGTDQIQLIKHIDPQVILNHPKPFFGYSDNTHFHNFLWNLDIPSFYGGSTMTQLGMQQKMFAETVDSLNWALFEGGRHKMPVSKQYNDIGLDWSKKENLQLSRELEPNEGPYWDVGPDIGPDISQDVTSNVDHNVEGMLWGGCVESLIVQSTTEIYLPSDNSLDGAILVLETSETIPPNWVIRYLLTGFGERGWLNKFKAILVGRPKAWEFDNQQSKEQKVEYSKTQRDVVVEIVRQYNSTMPIVQNLDFGHTDPQVILPFGQKAEVLVSTEEIFLHY